MSQTRWSAVLYNLCFALNCLLLFLAAFGNHMEVPVPLQVAGRMHPLILHFPIVLLLLAGGWEIFVKNRDQPLVRATGDALLLSSALSAALTALLGLFLSKEGGYAENTLFWHQWSGVLTALLAWGWYAYREAIRRQKILLPVLGAAGLTGLLIAGHLGATLTHGDNYLWAPMNLDSEKTPEFSENAPVFEQLVRPILKEKCMGCHNSKKMKGELNMETEEGLLKGGKNGKLWDSTAVQFGILLERLHLPLEEKEHMPPKGKPQLTATEISILYHWIKNGASFTQKIVDLPENDSLRLLANMRATTRVAPTGDAPYPFEAADEADIQKLNNDYRVVAPLALNSPALGVDFFGVAAFKSAFLQELSPVKTQIIHLNLNKMPVQDADLKTIAGFPNLRKLNLAFTQITGSTLGELKALKSLQSLSLSGTSVKIGDLTFLGELPALREVFLWNTPVAEAEIAGLKQRFPAIYFESGFKGEGIVAKLNAPLIEGGEQVFSAQTKVGLKNFIRGAVLRYTLDGSVPDSLHSPVYSGDSIFIDRSCQLQARAFLAGWISSEASTRSFYKTGILPDSVILRYPPNPDYKGEGAQTLANKKIGDTDFRSNKWLGYKETDLEASLLFREPVTLRSVSLSTLVDIGSYIMPAAEIQVWGGSNPKQLVLLKKITPVQPDKLGQPGYRVGFTCSFEPRKLSVLKIIAKPVHKLPGWHPGKGEKGWVFVDELFLE